jgi:hypothetical protein
MNPQLAILTFAVALAVASCSSPAAKSAKSGEVVPIDVTVTYTPAAVDAPKRPAETDRYFKHPGAILVAKWNVGNRGSCSMELSRNFMTPAPDPDHPESAFRSGCGFGNDDGIFYEFVRKTEHGDVYLFRRGWPGTKQVLTLVLFEGTALTVVAEKDLQVQILPSPPQAAK